MNVEGTIVGGTLNTASGGLMQTVSSADLNGVTISSGSTYAAGPGTTTQLNGAIVNDGTFAINGASGNSIVNLGSDVTLSGGGAVTMASGASGSAFLRGRSLTLTNTNNTIQGAGLIGDNGELAIVNQATIDANSSGQDLNLNQGGGGVTNTGTLEATGGGVLQLFNTITNTGGAITASGTGSDGERRRDDRRRHAEHGQRRAYANRQLRGPQRRDHLVGQHLCGRTGHDDTIERRHRQ